MDELCGILLSELKRIDAVLNGRANTIRRLVQQVDAMQDLIEMYGVAFDRQAKLIERLLRTMGRA